MQTLTQEELARLEKRLKATPDDLKIKALINSRRGLEFLEKRLKDLAEQFAEAEPPKEISAPKGGMIKVLRYPAKLVRIQKDTNLPSSLPDSLVYWNRLECKVVSQRVIKR